MASVLERLRDALVPDYELERELGGGGMGVVFLARDTALDRRVAIKIVRPELATARATERFLREAKLLAQLKHPNIMPVHRAGEAGGFAYYVMDFCEDETLHARLERGPLGPPEAVRLGRQLLEGLEAVHRAGLVHRDIKPANVFLLGDRAVLGDFGLAIPETVGTSTPTEPAGFVGTPGYTPPEQAAGGVVTARTDLYAVGVVLYEALSGKRWYAPAPEGAPDWSGVPAALRPVLRRALSWSPDRRWRDAASFRRALVSEERGPARWRAALAGLPVVAVLLAWLVWPRPAPPDPSMRFVRVRAFDPSGVPGRPMLGDSLARLVAGDLAGIPEIVVLSPTDTGGRAAVELGGTLHASGAMLCARALLEPSRRPAAPLPEICAPSEPLVALADSLARQVMLTIWTGDQPLIADLPRNAIPSTPRGVAEWARAERLFAQGRWGEAYQAYLDAERTDTTCWLCTWRLYWVESWRALPHDEDRFRRFLAHSGVLPPQYRSVMRASALPVAERLDTLRRAALQYPHFFFAWWFLGEEQFHRGPMVGRWRREALESFVRATELSPTFAPAWEHLAWLRTAEGDSAGAHQALDQWARAMGGEPRDTFSLTLRAFITTGFAWRFTSSANAERVTRASLLTPEILASPDLAAGPRLMSTAEVPRAAVWLGARLAEMTGRPHLARSGLLGQAFGYVALGQPDSTQARLDELLRRFPEPELVLFAAEFVGTLAYLDPDGVPGSRATERTLARLASPGTVSAGEAERAARILALLTGGPAVAGGTAELDRFSHAEELARQRRWREAIARTEPLVADPIRTFSDPVVRALVRFGRADWFTQMGNTDAARRELRWSEHSTMDVGFPVGPPQGAEVDWSLRTLARWRLATMLDQANQRDDETCLAYLRVADAWARGSGVFRARADTARRRAVELSCADAL